MDATATLNAELAGRYEIERELGEGGMATVYLARDLRHHRPVAVKVLKPELGAVLGVERFLSEIRVTANLQHPHLLPLFDSGTAGGLLFYVMPYIEGESLRARLDREKQLPVDDALRIALAVLAALDYAHGHGVVHRDLKPENILLQHGEPVVADFGIALAVSNAGGARITQTGLSLGTPQYMSPEQATGDRLVDARSDIYSVGAVLYEMLVGEPPHTGATVQAVIAKVITERPRSIRLQRDTVPEGLDAVVLKALAKLPADRWASAKDFAEALRASPGASAAVGARGPLARLGMRTTRALRSVAFWRTAAAAIAVAAAALAWRTLRPGAPVTELQLARQLTFEGNVVGAAISPDGGWLAYVSNDCFGKEFACSYTLQVREVDGTQSVKLLTWPTITSDLHWSADGGTIAFVGSSDSSAATLHLIPRLGGTPQRVPMPATAQTLAPDGHLVLASGEPGHQSLLWFDPRTLARTDSAPLPLGLSLDGFEFAPDGKRILAVEAFPDAGLSLLDGRGRLLDSSTALQPRQIARWHPSQTGFYIVSPAPGTGDNIRFVPIVRDRIRTDRARVALGMVQDGVDGLIDVARSGRLVVVDGPTEYDMLAVRLDQPGAQWRSVAQHTSWLWPNDVSPDGATIAGSATDNIGENVYLFPLSGGAPTQLTSQHGLRDYPYWSTDGRHLGYSVNDATTGTITEAAIIDRDGGREQTVHQGHDLGRTIGWAGNDALVLVHALKLFVVDTTGAVRRTLVIPDSLVIASRPIVNAATSRVVWWSPVRGAIVEADLARGTFASVARAPTQVQPIGWASDGALLVAAETSPTHTGPSSRREFSLLKLAPGSAGLVPMAPLPSRCWLSSATSGVGVIVGAGGRIAACSARRYTPDVWLADVGGKSGW